MGNGLSQYQLAVIQAQPLCVSAAGRPLAFTQLNLTPCPQDKMPLAPGTWVKLSRGVSPCPAPQGCIWGLVIVLLLVLVALIQISCWASLFLNYICLELLNCAALTFS